MAKRNIILLLTSITVLITSFNTATLCQIENEFKIEIAQPVFYFAALGYNSDKADTSRIDIYIQVPYAQLSFTKENELFYASYEVSLNLTDSLGNIVFNKLWQEQVSAQIYDETVSYQIGKLSYTSLFLPPGNYSIVIQIRDNETNKTTNVHRKFVLKKYDKSPFDVSDLLFINEKRKENSDISIIPNIPRVVGEGTDSFFVYFEVYSRFPIDSSVVVLKVYNHRREVIQTDSAVYSFHREKNPCFMKIISKDLTVGEYLSEIMIIPFKQTQLDTVRAIKSRPRSFTIKWRNLPKVITNLDLAIDQMRYAAPSDVREKIKSADPEQKRKMFLDFWKKRDPTPKTDRNELLEEYYSRVEIANKNFSHHQDGWKTDRGMIYIIFGPPSNIDRYPFEMDRKPYEVWTYYSLNRQFIFVDVTGFGDYRLKNPLWNVGPSGIR